VQGLFLAYRTGREEFQRHRGEPGTPLEVCCAWFDEFGVADGPAGAMADGTDLLARHQAFIDRRIDKLADLQNTEVRRRGAILPLEISPTTANDRASRQAHICGELAGLLWKAAVGLHRHHHGTDPVTGKRVSFGLIRMANIDPLFEVALALFRQAAPAGCHLHLCAYHARHPLVVRAEIERTLDAVLKRHDEDALFGHPDIRGALDASPEEDHLFIVLATAVAEVGRDHCYDWAIVEPSSMRSIIQLAGRVKRHRRFDCPPDQPNILLLDANVKALKNEGAGPAFHWPGFENTDFRLASHRLSEVLTPEQWQVIDARARIRPRAQLDPRHNLADLEHDRLTDLMLGAQPGYRQRDTPVHWWWSTRAHLTGALQARKPFRDDPLGHCTYIFLPDEDGAHAALAEGMEMEPAACARKFGTVDLPGRDGQQRWRYHPLLGFSRE
jgi:CRISPR-associated endonuclease/helicase Cas3